MKKEYRILLCEDFYNSEKEIFENKPVCEIASFDSDFRGQAQQIEFYSKIDGTHTLSFTLPQFYFDEEQGENIINPLVELIVNKSVLELQLNGELYYFTVNTKDENRNGNAINYSYSCTDTFIEELSKTGYGILFTDDINGNGLGTIHELAEQVAENSPWTYRADKTGTLYEYTTDISYNVEQQRYDDVYVPVPVHPVQYVPEVERYCYELEVFTKDNNEKYRKIYCYDDTEQVVSGSVKNILYNGDDFIDIAGWKSFQVRYDFETDKPTITNGLWIESYKFEDVATGKKDYCLKASAGAQDNTGYLLNDTAAETNGRIAPDSPYAFVFNLGETKGGKILEVNIFADNPMTFPDQKPEYSLFKEEGFNPGQYYCIKSKFSVTNPYIVFFVDCREGDLVLKDVTIFPIKGKDTEDMTAEQNNLTLLANLTDGVLINTEYLDIMQMPEGLITAYTHKFLRYFTRNNYEYKNNKEIVIDPLLEEEVVTYLDFSEVNSSQNFVLQENSFIPYSQKEIISVDALTDEIKDNSDIIYLLSSDGKHYQYYALERNGIVGGDWDYALFGDGAQDKRRTLTAEKSNRFNLIQEIAELFKVWPVFHISRDENGNLIREFWYRESFLKENFSGFHKGINLTNLSRKINSDEVTTKMIVEDIENEHADSGFVTIRTAALNPWGENHYYNFKYFINQKILNTMVDGVPLIEIELNELYSKVKEINTTLFELNDQLTELNYQKTTLAARLSGYSLSIASANESIASLEADLEKYKDIFGAPDIEDLNQEIAFYQEQKEKAQNLRDGEQKEFEQIKKDYEGKTDTRNSLQKEKETLIHAFESKYISYIKEGVWSDSTYIDNDAYFIDSQKVMKTSSIPKIDWSISVADVLILEEFEDFKVQVGDKTFLWDDEFFNENELSDNHTFEILITGIKECLDNPTSNTIEVRNYSTSFEDLFQRISAATQTLELKEQVYDKAAYFTKDGQVDKDILQKTLLENMFILSNSTDNSWELNENGLSLQSIINPSKKMRIVADGLFVSNSTNINTGQPEWKTGITADGINASLLTAGEINTSLIKIYSNDQPSFSWNKVGLTAYGFDRYGKVDSNSFVRLDSYGLYSIKDNTGFNLNGNNQPWFTGLSRTQALNSIVDKSVFSLTERGFNLNVENGEGSIRLGYASNSSIDEYGLYIKDKEGKLAIQLQNDGQNYISGWYVTPYAFESSIENSKQKFLISSTNSNSPNWLTAYNTEGEQTFYVTKDGILHAVGADISGEIKVGGSLADFTISENRISSSGGVGLSGSGTYAYWAGDNTPSKADFSVTHDGKVTLKSVTFGNYYTVDGETIAAMYNSATGGSSDTKITQIFADSGKIGGFFIDKHYLYGWGVPESGKQDESYYGFKINGSGLTFENRGYRFSDSLNVPGTQKLDLRFIDMQLPHYRILPGDYTLLRGYYPCLVFNYTDSYDETAYLTFWEGSFFIAHRTYSGFTYYKVQLEEVPIVSS